MQAKSYNELFGDVKQFNEKDLNELLSDANTEHVEVFKTTDEEIEKLNDYKNNPELEGLSFTKRIELLKRKKNINTK